MQIESLQSQLAAASSRAEAAERAQHAATAEAVTKLGRAQQEVQEARSAQFVAEEAHKTADAAAKLLAQKIMGEQDTKHKRVEAGVVMLVVCTVVATFVPPKHCLHHVCCVHVGSIHRGPA